jgi:hypothetical protein
VSFVKLLYVFDRKEVRACTPLRRLRSAEIQLRSPPAFVAVAA